MFKFITTMQINKQWQNSHFQISVACKKYKIKYEMIGYHKQFQLLDSEQSKLAFLWLSILPSECLAVLYKLMFVVVWTPPSRDRCTLFSPLTALFHIECTSWVHLNNAKLKLDSFIFQFELELYLLRLANSQAIRSIYSNEPIHRKKCYL